MRWTDERVAQLRQLWTVEGLSASQCAKRLGEGCTRNAVVGKVFRSNFPPRSADARMAHSKHMHLINQARGQSSWRKRHLRLTTATFVPAVEPLNLGVLDLRSDCCKWPTSEDRPHTFCGHPSVPGMPYCADHCAQAFQSERPKAPRPPAPVRHDPAADDYARMLAA